jgi:hypothetical protein
VAWQALCHATNALDHGSVNPSHIASWYLLKAISDMHSLNDCDQGFSCDRNESTGTRLALLTAVDSITAKAANAELEALQTLVCGTSPLDCNPW